MVMKVQIGYKMNHSVKVYTSVMSFSLPVSCTAFSILAIAHLFLTMSSWSARLFVYSLPFSISKAFSFLREVSSSFFNFYSCIFI